MIENECPRCGEEKFSFDSLCGECLIKGVDDSDGVDYTKGLGVNLISHDWSQHVT